MRKGSNSEERRLFRTWAMVVHQMNGKRRMMGMDRKEKPEVFFGDRVLVRFRRKRG